MKRIGAIAVLLLALALIVSQIDTEQLLVDMGGISAVITSEPEPEETDDGFEEMDLFEEDEVFEGDDITDSVIYKWKDENGIARFSNIRPVNVADVEAVSSDEYKVQTFTLEEAPAEEEQDQAPALETTIKPDAAIRKNTTREKKLSETEKYGKMPPGNVLFTGYKCKYCDDAKAFLRSQGIGFTEYNIDSDKSAWDKMRAWGGFQYVPFAVLNGKRLNGFSEGAYRSALKLPYVSGNTVLASTSRSGSSSKKSGFRPTGKS